MSANTNKWVLTKYYDPNSNNYNELTKEAAPVVQHGILVSAATKRVYFKTSGVLNFCAGIIVHDVSTGNGASACPDIVADKEEIKDLIFKHLRRKGYAFAVVADNVRDAEVEKVVFKASTLFSTWDTLSPVRINVNSGNKVQMCIVDLTEY